MWSSWPLLVGAGHGVFAAFLLISIVRDWRCLRLIDKQALAVPERKEFSDSEFKSRQGILAGESRRVFAE